MIIFLSIIVEKDTNSDSDCLVGGCHLACGAIVSELISYARGPEVESHWGQEYLGLQHQRFSQGAPTSSLPAIMVLDAAPLH